MRQCEFKRRYNLQNGKYEKQHIYGEGVLFSFSNMLGRMIFSETAKKIAKDTSKKIAYKTGEYAGNKAGSKIFQLLQKQSPNMNQIDRNSTSNKEDLNLSDYEINERVQRLLGSGKIRKLKI